MTEPAATAAPLPDSGPAARAVSLTKVYSQGSMRVVALDAVDVDLAAREFTAIMGPSGSGKSTLMHCMAGLDSITDGEVYLGDTALSTLSDRALTQLRRDEVGFVFQSFNLIPTLSAAENITLPLDIAGRKPDAAWFDTVIDTVGLRDRLDHRPSELSGGQQQRVAVARALANTPSVILADEPTGNLDTKTGAEIIALLKELNREKGVTIITATHDPKMLESSDRICWIRDGHLDRIERNLK